MFDNPGKKIKVIAKILFWLVLIASIAAIILEFRDNRHPEIKDVVYFIIAPFAQWVTSLFLVAFGELVENSTKLASSSKFSRE